MPHIKKLRNLNFKNTLIRMSIPVMILALSVSYYLPTRPVSAAPTCDRNATTATFSAQISAATAGQTVCLASGDYGTFTGTNKVITITAADGASPVMKFNFASGDSGFTLDGLTGLGGFINTGASNITIKNSVFALGNCWGIGCLQIEGAVTNIIIDNNDFSYATGTTCSGANSKIFTDTSGASIGSALKITNNSFRNGDKDGIHVGGGSGVLVENNTFIDITDVNITCPGGGDSNHADNIQFEGGTRINIKGNYIKACDGCGTQGITSFDSGTDGVIIENNVVDIGRPWAIELYSDQNSIVRHNTLIWRADADCDFTGVQCGMIDVTRKLSDPAGSNTQVYDNITTRVDFSNSSTGTDHHNVSGQTASYVGPTNYHDGFLLTAGSPVGRNAASDGTNIGIYSNGAVSTLTQPLYRLYAPSVNYHFWTASSAERDWLAITRGDFVVEGNSGKVSATAGAGLVPLYRLYAPSVNKHFWTTSAAERDWLAVTRGDFVYEGITGYVSDISGSGLTPLYRLYAPSVNKHFWTNSSAERDWLAITRGDFTSEGTTGYVGQ